MVVRRKNRGFRPTERQLAVYGQYASQEKTIVALALQEGVHKNTIAAWLRKIENHLYKELAEGVYRIKVGQTEGLRTIARKAMVAWEVSREPHVVIHERNLKDGTMYTERTTSPSSGDPRHLMTVIKAMADIRKIWGADAPKQVQLDARVDAHIDVVSPEDRLQAIAERMAELIPQSVMNSAEGDRQRQPNLPLMVESDAQLQNQN